jgi:hypothetical protein
MQIDKSRLFVVNLLKTDHTSGELVLIIFRRMLDLLVFAVDSGESTFD